MDTEVQLERQVGRAQDRRPVEAFELRCGFCLIRAVAGVRKILKVGRQGLRTEGAGQALLGVARARRAFQRLTFVPGRYAA